MVDIVIVEPEIPGNLGAIARVMKNFSFRKLVIVNPGFSMDCEELRNRAKHANDILDEARIVDSMDDLSYDYRIGTTGKLSSDYNLKRTPMTPKELAEKLSNTVNDGMAIFFGRESHGLTNEELASMDFMINVPTDKSYGVMNLSHSVAIILYELYNTEGTKRRDERYKPLGRKERESIENLYKEIISRLDFETDSKFRIQRVLWQKIIAKSMLSNREGYALMGFLRKIKDRISR